MGKIFRPQTIAEAVLAELRRLICDGELPPGTVIRLDAVARALEVSRIPVREALKVLEGEGLVAHRPRGDYEVPSLRAEKVREIYRLRALLESEALRSRASRSRRTARRLVQQSQPQNGTWPPATPTPSARTPGTSTR